MPPEFRAVRSRQAPGQEAGGTPAHRTSASGRASAAGPARAGLGTKLAQALHVPRAEADIAVAGDLSRFRPGDGTQLVTVPVDPSGSPRGRRDLFPWSPLRLGIDNNRAAIPCLEHHIGLADHRPPPRSQLALDHRASELCLRELDRGALSLVLIGQRRHIRDLLGILVDHLEAALLRPQAEAEEQQRLS